MTGLYLHCRREGFPVIGILLLFLSLSAATNSSDLVSGSTTPPPPYSLEDLTSPLGAGFYSPQPSSIETPSRYSPTKAHVTAVRPCKPISYQNGLLIINQSSLRARVPKRRPDWTPEQKYINAWKRRNGQKQDCQHGRQKKRCTCGVPAHIIEEAMAKSSVHQASPGANFTDKGLLINVDIFPPDQNDTMLYLAQGSPGFPPWPDSSQAILADLPWKESELPFGESCPSRNNDLKESITYPNRDFLNGADHQSIVRPVTQEQLANEVKMIYAGLGMVERKCVEIDRQQRAMESKLSDEQWKALIALHRALLYEHHDFFLASQHPSSSEVDVGDRDIWADISRMWYKKRQDQNVNVGRIRHHLAVLARPDLLQLRTSSMVRTESPPNLSRTAGQPTGDPTKRVSNWTHHYLPPSFFQGQFTQFEDHDMSSSSGSSGSKDGGTPELLLEAQSNESAFNYLQSSSANAAGQTIVSNNISIVRERAANLTGHQFFEDLTRDWVGPSLRPENFPLPASSTGNPLNSHLFGSETTFTMPIDEEDPSEIPPVADDPALPEMDWDLEPHVFVVFDFTGHSPVVSSLQKQHGSFERNPKENDEVHLALQVAEKPQSFGSNNTEQSLNEGKPTNTDSERGLTVQQPSGQAHEQNEVYQVFSSNIVWAEDVPSVLRQPSLQLPFDVANTSNGGAPPRMLLSLLFFLFFVLLHREEKL